MKRTKYNTLIINHGYDHTSGELDYDMYIDIFGVKKVNSAYDEDGIAVESTLSSLYDNTPIKLDVLKTNHY